MRLAPHPPAESRTRLRTHRRRMTWLAKPRCSPSRRAIRLPGSQSRSRRHVAMAMRDRSELRKAPAEHERREVLAQPDLEGREVLPGQKAGDAYKRNETHKGVRPRGPGLW